MPVRSRALFAVLAIAAGVALLPAATASGAGASTTKVVVSLKLPAFHGTLKSPRHGCLGSRKMTLYRKKAGPDKKLGTDKSEDNGGWSIVIGRKHVPSGSYYVTAAARGACKSGKSKVIPVA
jgi:hypothetical protein